MKIIKDLFTSRDNQTFSLSKTLAFTAGCALIFNFIKLDSADMQGFGIAIGAMIAALAAKSATDKERE